MKAKLLNIKWLLFLLLAFCTEPVFEYNPNPPAKINQNSVYQINGNWTDEENRAISLNQFIGKPRVVCMIFTTCPSACPTLVQNMKHIESKLSQNELNKIGFLLISFDTEIDKPAKLKQYQSEKRLDPTRWTLLVGDEDKTMEIANVLDVRYTKLAGGGFDHSNIITLLDKDGVIVNQISGLDADNQDFIEKVKDQITQSKTSN